MFSIVVHTTELILLLLLLFREVTIQSSALAHKPYGNKKKCIFPENDTKQKRNYYKYTDWTNPFSGNTRDFKSVQHWNPHWSDLYICALDQYIPLPFLSPSGNAHYYLECISETVLWLPSLSRYGRLKMIMPRKMLDF